MVWNKKMLTVEDTNSIIQHFGKGFIDYYIIDTTELIIEESYFAYDFITITKLENLIEFDICNNLWTGGYRILDCNIESPSISILDNIITVSGNGLTDVILELELSPDFKHNNIFEMNYKVVYDKPVVIPFYETDEMVVQILDKEDKPVSGLSIYDLIKEETLITDNNGKVTIFIDSGKGGDFYYSLQFRNGSETVTYNLLYRRLKSVIPFEIHNNHYWLENTVYRASTNLLFFNLLYDETYSIDEKKILKSGKFIILYNNKEYVGNVYEEDIMFHIEIGSESNVEIELLILDNDYLESTPIKYSLISEYPTCKTIEDLRYYVTEYSIIIFTGSGELLSNSNTSSFTSIDIEKDVKIIFTDIVSINNDVPFFKVSSDASLILDNFNIESGGCIVESSGGNIRLENCNINHITDSIIKGKGDVKISNSSFIDNNQVIDVEGDVDVDTVLFDLSDNEYLDINKVPFINVYGNLKMNSCNFDINLDNLDKLGYSYVCVKIGEEFTTNNVDNNKLFTNEVFPIDNNNCSINVKSDDYEITSKSLKSFTYTIIGTNTVFSNKMSFKYNGD